MARQLRVTSAADVTGQFTGDVVLVDANGNRLSVLKGTAPTIANSATFADLAAATTAHNALLAALRTRGVLAP